MGVLFLILGCSTAVFFMIVPIFYPIDGRPLPLLLWLPIEVDKTNYWYFYCFEIPAIVYGGINAAASDVFIFWLFYQINIQFDILKDRMTILPKTALVLKRDKHSKRGLEHHEISENVAHVVEITEWVQYHYDE